jgi:SnoaL-like domain
MPSVIPATIQSWHRVALQNLPDEIAPLLAEDVVFESPVVHTPQVGKAITDKYLRAALKVLNTIHFKYVGEWFAERSAVLEFVTEIDGVRINGVDIIDWNEAGLITRFKVMVRPLKAINTLHQKMGELLTKAP